MSYPIQWTCLTIWRIATMPPFRKVGMLHERLSACGKMKDGWFTEQLIRAARINFGYEMRQNKSRITSKHDRTVVREYLPNSSLHLAKYFKVD
jgi:hypothetical protein